MSFEKDLYTEIFNKVEHHHEIKDVVAKVGHFYYVFRELLAFFDGKTEFTVKYGDKTVMLYDLIKEVESKNISFLNLHIHKNGEYIGNPCDKWCEQLPDYIKEYLFEIF